ncbi:uncharacterized protein SPSK_03910 [Sporothrix schenckii 1099-18]|uniref:Uncharacterized protein n=1 Tax=Sporothrix schenckii 1099-18 TaxID=1397361 RepID=A0A0F2M4B9_SPOSC|nr:uncharacterized protein SPSK_03910 [Sporothrix schenckii 1099-18]KJR83021.1 hypothetical protein SPSK_03910 [Sporothrix schenckii 1099-18]
MGLCFCNRHSLGLSADAEQRHPLPLSLSSLPAAPRPAKLARPVLSEITFPVPPSTPPPPRTSSRLHAALSPRRGTGRCPIPKIPDFEGLADSETDSDDELLSHARMRAAGLGATPVPSTPVKLGSGGASGGVGGSDGAGMSPLTSLISRIGIIGRTSPARAANQGRTPESSCSTDDLVAAARRAEVRRLTQKMIQEELQNEQQQQQQFLYLQQQRQQRQQYQKFQQQYYHQAQPHQPRTYKRSSMSTIKEDPADISSLDLAHPRNTVAVMDGSGYRTSLEFVFTRSRDDLSVPPALSNKGKVSDTYLLPKPPLLPPSVLSKHFASQAGKAGLPEGPGECIQVHGGGSLGREFGDFISASFATDPSARRPLPEGALSFVPTSTQDTVAAGVTTGTTGKTVASSTHVAEPGQKSLRVKHVASNGGPAQKNSKDKIKGQQDDADISETAQAVSDSLSSMDEDGSIHEARKARIVVSGRARNTSNHIGSTDDTVEKAEADTFTATHKDSPLLTAVARFRKSRRKTSESSYVSTLDLPPPLVNDLSNSNNSAPAQAETIASNDGSEADTQSLPRRNGFKRLPLLSLDRFTFGLRKSSNSAQQASELSCVEQIPQSNSVASVDKTVAASVASSGAQFDSQRKENTNHDDKDSISTKSQYHSMSGASLKNGVKEKPASQSDPVSMMNRSSRASAHTTSTDIDRMAEEWHRQLQNLDHNSPLHNGATATTQRRSMSDTYPLSHQESGFRDLPPPASIMGPWSDNQAHNTGGKPGIRRQASSIHAQQLSDSWWTEASWKERPENNKANDPVKTTGQGVVLPPSKEDSVTLPREASQATEVDKDVQPPEPQPSYSRVFSSGIEKAILAGIKKVMYRKQMSTPSLTTLTPAAAVSSRSLGPERAITTTHSKASSLKLERSTPESRAMASTRTSEKIATSAASETPGRKDEVVIQDIDSIFGVLVDMESNQRTTPTTPMKPKQVNNADGCAALPESDIASPETVPSTPIANAYAEMRAYISAVLPSTPAPKFKELELHNSPCSSHQEYQEYQEYQEHQETASHQSSDAVHVVAQANTQVTTHKSADSMSVKSDSAPVKKVAEFDTASAKYMTWSGHTKPKTPLMTSAVQPGDDLKTIFQGRKENRKSFQGRTLQPALKQN